MKSNPLTLTCVPTVKEIQKALITGFSTFPIINESGFLIGNISKNFLVVLMKNKAFFKNQVNAEKHQETVDRKTRKESMALD